MAENENIPADSESPAEQAPEVEVAEAPAQEVSKPAPPLPEGAKFIWGVGRRKSAVARVRIRPGTGNILINKRKRDEYFCREVDRNAVDAPLAAVSMPRSWDIFVNVNGGGTTGQAGAVMLGLARALCKAAPEIDAILRTKGLLTRDARMVERKKYGQKGARKRFQFSKR